MHPDFSEAVKIYALNTGVSEDLILEAIKQALTQAYKKKFKKENIIVKIDNVKKNLDIFCAKKVVEKVEDEIEEISIEEARKIKKDAQLNDTIEIKINPEELGRITAQMTHHIILANIRNIELEMLTKELESKLGEIVSGQFQRRYRNNDISVNLGKIEAILPYSEQMPKDKSKIGEKVKVLIKSVERIDKRVRTSERLESFLRVTVSRADPKFVIKLFEAEVPEIREGIIEIKGIARQPGERTKIAVYTLREGIDPVGSCVGMKGVRIQSVIRELDGEKIDVVRWENNYKRLISNLLSPAKVVDVKTNVEAKTALVIVQNDSLAAAIGKDGINVKLASKLLDWTIDIKSLQEFEKMMEDEETKKKIEELFPEPVKPIETVSEEVKPEEEKFEKPIAREEKEEISEEEVEETSIFELPDVPHNILKRLKDSGYDTIESIIDLKFEDLIKIQGIDKKAAELILKSLKENVKVIIEE